LDKLSEYICKTSCNILLREFKRGWLSGQKRQAVNLLIIIFVGSNPTPLTSFADMMELVDMPSLGLGFY
tara:strand:- start:7846 stop:8052 length:207 start_codon:yes stop_codon:yes gene_type:complete